MLAIPPLAAETIFHIGTFPVFNTYINSSIVLLLFLTLGLMLRKQSREIPGALQNFFEAILDVLFGYMDQVTHDRKKSLQFLPVVGTLFLFILISNWIGIFPGVGSIGRWLPIRGAVELVPLFRPANTDLNMTLAMAVLGVALSHVFGIAAIGFFKYFNKFIKVGDIVSGFKKGGMNIFVAVVEFGVGLIEIVSEIAKLASLSLRLFGNVFAGEVLLTVIAGLATFTAYFVPLPFLMLEILVGLIQAVVFAMLVLVFLTMATTEVAESH